MPIKNRFLIALFALVVTSLMIATAHADLLKDIKKRGEFIAGTEARFPPFEFVENGKIVGYSTDIMKEIMKQLPGVKLTRLDLPWQGILPGLEAKKFDYVITSVTVTPERYDRYALSYPIADATMAIMQTQGGTLSTPSDISGKKVGTQAGSAHLEALRAFAETLPGGPPAEIKTYVDYNEAYADLGAGRIDAVANSLPNLLDAEKKRPEIFNVVKGTFGPKKYYSWAARKEPESQSLTQFINTQLKKLEADGTLAKLQTKWFGGPMELPKGDLQRP